MLSSRSWLLLHALEIRQYVPRVDLLIQGYQAQCAQAPMLVTTAPAFPPNYEIQTVNSLMHVELGVT